MTPMVERRKKEIFRANQKGNGNMDGKYGIDREAIVKAHALLDEALKCISSLTDRPLRRVTNNVKEAFSLLGQELGTTPLLSKPVRFAVADEPLESPSLTLPTEAPIKWANRATFALDEIKDENLRLKLEANPNLERQIRECTTKNPLTFLDIIYGDYIKAGLVGQKELRGGGGQKPLDERLFAVCSAQCKASSEELKKYLPTVSNQINKKIQDKNFKDFKDIKKAVQTVQKREQKSKKFVLNQFPANV